jgi:hypothetical protein
MANSSEYGSPITRDEADAIIKSRIEINQELKEVIKSSSNLKAFNNDINGFVFSKDVVMGLFNNQSAWGELDCLVIILGLETNNTQPSPTVVLTACTSRTVENGKIKLLTPNVEQPASETPPKQILSELPSSLPDLDKDNINSLVFTVQ